MSNFKKDNLFCLTKLNKDVNINNVVSLNINQLRHDMERWSSWFMAPVLKIGVR